jgi:hypothetical protein
MASNVPESKKQGMGVLRIFNFPKMKNLEKLFLILNFQSQLGNQEVSCDVDLLIARYPSLYAR